MGAADLNIPAEIAMAYTEAVAIERRLAADLVSIKRRKACHVTARALRVYMAILEDQMDRDAASAAIKVGERRANVAVPVTDQAVQEVHPFHGPTMERISDQRHIAER